MSIIGKKFKLSDVYKCKVDEPTGDLIELLYKPGPLIYLIENDITNQKYVGRTESHLYWRLFKGINNCGHLIQYESAPFNYYRTCMYKYNSMKKYGLENFTISILESPIVNSEEYYIDLFKCTYDDIDENGRRGFNSTVDGERLSINYESKTRMVLDGKALYIHNSLVDKALSEGWVPEGPTAGRVCLNRDIDGVRETVRVPEDEVDDYLDNGWYYGHNGNGLKVLKHPTEHTYIRVPEDEVDTYLKKGYCSASTVSEYLMITNGVSQKMIPKNDPIPNGWRKGVKDSSPVKDSDEQKRRYHCKLVKEFNKTIDNLKSLGLEVNEINYNNNRVPSNALRYKTLKSKLPELFD